MFFMFCNSNICDILESKLTSRQFFDKSSMKLCQIQQISSNLLINGEIPNELILLISHLHNRILMQFKNFLNLYLLLFDTFYLTFDKYLHDLIEAKSTSFELLHRINQDTVFSLKLGLF